MDVTQAFNIVFGIVKQVPLKWEDRDTVQSALSLLQSAIATKPLASVPGEKKVEANK